MNDLIRKDSLFWFFALLGSGLFVIQLLLSFFSAESDDTSEFDGNFKWLSKQALTGFLMMFGWAGLTCRKEFGLSNLVSTLIAFASGGVALFCTALIFQGAKKLKSTGTIFNIEDAIGKEATVYQSIPKDGVGKITVSLHNFTHEIDAISHQDLPSFTSVQIIKKADEKTVVVIPTKEVSL